MSDRSNLPKGGPACTDNVSSPERKSAMIIFFMQNIAMSVTAGFLRGINEVFAVMECQAAFTVNYCRFGTSPINAESHPRTSKTS